MPTQRNDWALDAGDASPSSNWILSRLIYAQHARFLSRLQLVPLQSHDTIYDAGAPLQQIYFPVRGVLAVIRTMRDGDGLEVASIGREGLYGYNCCESSHSVYRVLVQSSGTAYRIDTATLQIELRDDPTFRQSLNLFQTMLSECIAQTAACNGLHTVMQRCCRWLLTSADRLETDELSFTHDFLAVMLGVRRPSVSDALQPLLRQEIIRHRRGKLAIVDHRALEERSCECFRTLKERRKSLAAANAAT